MSLENRIQSSTSAGLCTGGACIGMGTWSQSVTTWLQNRFPIRSFSRSMVSYLALSQACQSWRDSSLKENSVPMATNAVVHLPAHKLGMFAEGVGQFGDNAAGILPVNIAVHAVGVAGAFTHGQPAFIQGQDFRVFAGQPDGRGGGRGPEHDLDAGHFA